MGDLERSRLGLGANTFGWTADRDAAFAVLDAYVDAGGSFVDTADSYGRQSFVGASETIIGEWFAARGRRDDVVLATKVGSLPSRPGLSAANITAAVDESLRRLQTDRIDLYWAHKDDPDTPQEETLAAFDGLVRAGKVREIGASNFSAARLESALAISAKEGLAAYVALQPHYNLMERAEFEAVLLPVLAEHGLSCVPYFGLARGFLTGKYRPGTTVDSPRAAGRVGLPRRARAARCSPCWTRWRRRTACRWRPSRWPGSPRSRRWRRPSPAPGRPISWPTCCPTLSLDADGRGGGGAVRGVAALRRPDG